MGIRVKQRTPYRWIEGLIWGLLSCGWLWVAPVLAAPTDETVLIGSITVNPMANNRRAVTLQGKTRTVTTYNGQDSFGREIVANGLFWRMTPGRLMSCT
jgi:hypothetical protein